LLYPRRQWHRRGTLPNFAKREIDNFAVHAGHGRPSRLFDRGGSINSIRPQTRGWYAMARRNRFVDRCVDWQESESGPASAVKVWGSNRIAAIFTPQRRCAQLPTGEGRPRVKIEPFSRIAAPTIPEVIDSTPNFARYGAFCRLPRPGGRLCRTLRTT
jgi:hypothetical protein